MNKLALKISFLFLPLLLLVLASVWFLKSYSGFVPTLTYNTLIDHKMGIRNSNSNIVMIGDSSLLNGVIPEIIDNEVGLKSINLGLYAFSGIRSYHLLLDNYLKYNKQPKYIVFYFAPFSPYKFDDSSFEKTYTIVKYDHQSNYLRYISIPDIILAAQTLLERIITKKLSRNQMIDKASFIGELVSYKGYLNNTKNGLLNTTKKLNSRQNVELDTAFVEDFKKKYEINGTRVLICLAPMPEHDESFDYFSGIYAKSDKPPVRYANSFFTDSTHLTAVGALSNSKTFARSLNQIIELHDNPNIVVHSK